MKADERGGFDLRGLSGNIRQSALSVAQQWPYLRFLGMGAWWAWIWLCYSSVELMRLWPEELQPQTVQSMYLISTASIAAMMLVAVVAWKRFSKLVVNEKVLVCAGVVGGIATLSVGFAYYAGPLGHVMFAVSCITTGLATSFLALRMGYVYGSVGMRESLTAGSVSLLLAASLYFVGIGIPVSWRVFFIAVLPVLAALLFIMPTDDPDTDESFICSRDFRGKVPGRRSFLHLVTAAAGIAFTAGVGKGMLSVDAAANGFGEQGSICTFIVALFSVFIIFMVNNGDIVKSTKRVYSLLMAWGVLVLLATCFGLSFAYLSIGKELLWMLLSVFMAYMAFRFDFNPVRTFGLGQLAYFLASAAGWFLGSLVQAFMPTDQAHMIIAVFFAFLIVVILAIVFTDADLKFILTWHDAENEPAFEAVPFVSDDDVTGDSEISARDSGVDALTSGIASLDPKYGVSGREAEILDLFAHGRSASWIAEYLTISKNTVRSHLRSIYTKLDVHTRQELLDFLLK